MELSERVLPADLFTDGTQGMKQTQWTADPDVTVRDVAHVGHALSGISAGIGRMLLLSAPRCASAAPMGTVTGYLHETIAWRLYRVSTRAIQGTADDVQPSPRGAAR